jgi:hypothetical protein
MGTMCKRECFIGLCLKNMGLAVREKKSLTMSTRFVACQADEEEKRRIQEDEKRAAREDEEAALAAENSRQRKATEDAARAQRKEDDRNLRLAAQEKERR